LALPISNNPPLVFTTKAIKKRLGKTIKIIIFIIDIKVLILYRFLGGDYSEEGFFPSFFL
jgi:hypothetical protein